MTSNTANSNAVAVRKRCVLNAASACRTLFAAYLPSLWRKPSSNVAGFLLPGSGRGGRREIHEAGAFILLNLMGFPAGWETSPVWTETTK
jgi:hypothetical protein